MRIKATGTEPGRFHCDNCKCDITKGKRVKCSDCNDFDLCLDCFYSGIEVFPHKSSHSYQIVDDSSAPLFVPDWSAIEELLLLEGLSIYGIGNWNDVASHVGKPLEACRDHYFSVYINSSNGYLPDLDKSVASKLQKLSYNIVESEDAPEVPNKIKALALPPLVPPYVINSPYAPAVGPGGFTVKKQSDQESENIDEEKEDVWDPQRGKESLSTDLFDSEYPKFGNWVIPAADNMYPLSNPTRNDENRYGFNIYRREFDVEWQNDAEKVVQGISFGPNDTEETREIKFRALESYNQKLKWRHRRKQFVLEHDLLNFHNRQKNERKYDEVIRAMLIRTRAFLQFMTIEELDKLQKDLVLMEGYRLDIEQYKEYRSAGVREYADIEPYNEEVKRRRKHRDSLLSTRKLKPLKRKINIPVTAYKYYSILTRDEKLFCSEHKVTPKQYLVVKQHLLRWVSLNPGRLLIDAPEPVSGLVGQNLGISSGGASGMGQGATCKNTPLFKKLADLVGKAILERPSKK